MCSSLYPTQIYRKKQMNHITYIWQTIIRVDLDHIATNDYELASTFIQVEHDA